MSSSAIADYVRRHATPFQVEDFEERAAIGEYERGMSREESEREAARIVGVRIPTVEVRMCEKTPGVKPGKVRP